MYVSIVLLMVRCLRKYVFTEVQKHIYCEIKSYVLFKSYYISITVSNMECECVNRLFFFTAKIDFCVATVKFKSK